MLVVGGGSGSANNTHAVVSSGGGAGGVIFEEGLAGSGLNPRAENRNGYYRHGQLLEEDRDGDRFSSQGYHLSLADLNAESGAGSPWRGTTTSPEGMPAFCWTNSTVARLRNESAVGAERTNEHVA